MAQNALIILPKCIALVDTITGNDGAGAQLPGKLGLVNSVDSVMGYYMGSKNDA